MGTGAGQAGGSWRAGLPWPSRGYTRVPETAGRSLGGSRQGVESCFREWLDPWHLGWPAGAPRARPPPCRGQSALESRGLWETFPRHRHHRPRGGWRCPGSRPSQHVMRARAARHSCVVSHRLFTEQELTFPQTRPHPERKRKARPRTRLEQTPTRPDGDGCVQSQLGQGRRRAESGAGTSPVPTCRPQDLCWDSGTHTGWASAPSPASRPQEGQSPPTHQVKVPGPLEARTQARSLGRAGGGEGARVPLTWGLASACLQLTDLLLKDSRTQTA